MSMQKLALALVSRPKKEPLKTGGISLNFTD